METLSKVFEDKYNKNVKDCTNEEIYHGLLSWTKEQLKGRGYQEGKKKIYYISVIPAMTGLDIPSLICAMFFPVSTTQPAMVCVKVSIVSKNTTQSEINIFNRII